MLKVSSYSFIASCACCPWWSFILSLLCVLHLICCCGYGHPLLLLYHWSMVHHLCINALQYHGSYHFGRWWSSKNWHDASYSGIKQHVAGLGIPGPRGIDLTCSKAKCGSNWVSKHFWVPAWWPLLWWMYDEDTACYMCYICSLSAAHTRLS